MIGFSFGLDRLIQFVNIPATKNQKYTVMIIAITKKCHKNNYV